MRGIDYWIGGKSMKEMTASHLMEKAVVSFGEETTCHILAESMFEGGFGSIPIIDQDGILKGLVSEYDILDSLIKGKDLQLTPASEVMTKGVTAIQADMPCEEVIALLQDKHYIRVPVVNSENRLVGILSRRDVLGSYIESTMGGLPSL